MTGNSHIARNCDGVSNPEYRHPVKIGKDRIHILDRCPKALVNDVTADIVAVLSDVWFFMRTGKMPLAGGLLDQHPQWVAAERIISEEIER